MQKVVCVVCGLANLESFPTYPLCAGCGARLPEKQKRPLHDFFERPVQTLVWAFCMGAGIAALALISTGIARETRLKDRGALAIASSLEPEIESNGTDLLLQLTISTSVPGDHDEIENLRLRLDKKDARDAAVRVVSTLSSIRETGNGRYFEWDNFRPGQTVKVLLRPHRVLNLNIAANGFNPYTLKISPVKATRPPVVLSPNRSN